MILYMIFKSSQKNNCKYIILKLSGRVKGK